MAMIVLRQLRRCREPQAVAAGRPLSDAVECGVGLDPWDMLTELLASRRGVGLTVIHDSVENIMAEAHSNVGKVRTLQAARSY